METTNITLSMMWMLFIKFCVIVVILYFLYEIIAYIINRYKNKDNLTYEKYVKKLSIKLAHIIDVINTKNIKLYDMNNKLLHTFGKHYKNLIKLNNKMYKNNNKMKKNYEDIISINKKKLSYIEDRLNNKSFTNNQDMVFTFMTLSSMLKLQNGDNEIWIRKIIVENKQIKLTLKELYRQKIVNSKIGHIKKLHPTMDVKVPWAGELSIIGDDAYNLLMKNLNEIIKNSKGGIK